MADFNKLKKLSGQPWSSWTNFKYMTGDCLKKQKEVGHCTRLCKRDMPLFGICPKTEVFQLVICNLCGLKYKLPAFADHIKSRCCADTKNNEFIHDKPLQKKGKCKRPKEKLKPKFEPFDSVTIKLDGNMNIDFLEIVSDRQSLPVDSETVSKIKQIHLAPNTNVDSPEKDIIPNRDENGVLDTGSCKGNQSDTNSEILCQKFNESSIITAHVTIEGSPPLLPQGGEMINMQPVVKLSPLTKLTSSPGTDSITPKNEVQYCSTANSPIKEDANNESVIIESDSYSSSSKTNGELTEKNQASVVTEETHFLNSTVKRSKIVNEHGLSLPVSIKNPTILCQLQNIKSKYYTRAKAARLNRIQDIIKLNLGRRTEATKENMKESVIVKEENQAFQTSITESKPEWFQQWHPGYRRVGGLLYANHNITYVRRHTFIATVSSHSQEEHYNSFLQQRLNVIKNKSEIIDICEPDKSKIDLKRMKFESPGNKKSFNYVIPKQKGNFIMTSKNHSISQKLHLTQATNSKAFVCKRSSNAINGALPSKVKRQDGVINILNPLFGKINKTCL